MISFDTTCDEFLYENVLCTPVNSPVFLYQFEGHHLRNPQGKDLPSPTHFCLYFPQNILQREK